MKKAIKIFSILCAILVAVFTATFFNSYKISAETLTHEEINLLYGGDNEPLFTYEDNNIYILQENSIDLSIEFKNANQYDQEYIGTQTIIEFKTNLNNTIIIDPTGKHFISFMADLSSYITDVSTEHITELIRYKIYTANDELLYEYPETEDTTLIEDIFTETTTLLQKIVNFFVTAIQTIINLFWVAGTGLTNYGKLFLIPAGFAVFYKVMKWVSKLIRIR